jgi:dTDP-glucose 4,6-dehydratase
MTKRVLITGAGGSIGCHVLRHLLKNTDWEIVALDSFRHKGLTDRIWRVTHKHPETLSRLKVFTHDLRAPISNMLTEKMGPIDYIVNMASMTDVFDSIQHPVQYVQSNVSEILTMLEYARSIKPEIFLQVSTDEVYGPTDSKTFYSEWAPILPSNPYSASKAAQEAIATSYWRSYDVPLIITNMMNNFGEMQSPIKFMMLVMSALATGSTVTIHGTADAIGSRHYIHSRNAADAFLFLLKNTKPLLHVDGAVDRPDRYNVTGDRSVSNLEFAQLIAKAWGKPLKYAFEPGRVTRPGHDSHYGASGSKIEALGWKAPMSLEDSLRLTVEWYKRNPEWLRPW